MTTQTGKGVAWFFVAPLLATTALAQEGGIRKVDETPPTEPLVQEAEPTSTTFKQVVLRPLDEAKRDEEFLDFRNRLLAAIEAKDVAFLMAHVADNIKCSFGGESGIADFRSMWNLDSDPENSKLWKELEKTLELGGTFYRDTFTAPWVFTEFPEEFDPYQFAVVTGRTVNIRAQARSNAEAVGKVSYLVVRDLRDEQEQEVLEIIGDESHPWRKIGLPDGRTAYIYGKYLRSPLDFRAAFQPTDGVWKLTLFVEGD